MNWWALNKILIFKPEPSHKKFGGYFDTDRIFAQFLPKGGHRPLRD